MKLTIGVIIWVFVFVALAVAVAFWFIPRPVDVEVAEVSVGPLQMSILEDGMTRIREKFTVSTPVSGRLTRIELHPGDEICCEETLLATILPSDPAILDARTKRQSEARVSAAESSMERAKATAEQARIDFDLCEAKYDRAERLFPRKAISRNEYDTAKSEYLASVQAINSARFEQDIARFELEMARAAVAQIDGEDNSTPFEIRSPVSGTVLQVFQESSQVVAAGTPLLELGDRNHLEIVVDVLSTDAVKIKPGSMVTIDHWGGDQPLRAVVRLVEPAAFTKVSSLGVEEQRVNVIADFSEPTDRLTSLGDGFRVEARIIITEYSEVLQVPNSALFRHERRWHVMKVVDGKARFQAVEAGDQNETQTEIIAGLASGETVIVYPSDDIEAGASVRW